MKYFEFFIKNEVTGSILTVVKNNLNLPTKNSIKAYFVLRPISVEYRN